MHCCPRYRRAFLWSLPYGGLAYNYTLLSLMRRYQNLLAEYG